MKKLFSIFLSMVLITGCSTTSTSNKEVSNNIKSQVEEKTMQKSYM